MLAQAKNSPRLEKGSNIASGRPAIFTSPCYGLYDLMRTCCVSASHVPRLDSHISSPNLTHACMCAHTQGGGPPTRGVRTCHQGVAVGVGLTRGISSIHVEAEEVGEAVGRQWMCRLSG
jgi:hypothetical protein